MIVLVIVGATSAVAYPSYQQHLQTSRRVQAKAQLYQYAHELEKYYSLHLSYQGANPIRNSTEYHFDLHFTGNHRYEITATPIGSQRQDRCGTLSLNDKGIQQAGQDHCWQ